LKRDKSEKRRGLLLLRHDERGDVARIILAQWQARMVTCGINKKDVTISALTPGIPAMAEKAMARPAFPADMSIRWQAAQ